MKRNPFGPFGEQVAGYHTPVLNERAVRAAAGLLFLALAVSLALIWFERDFLLVKYVVTAFFTDFIVRVLVHPRFAPTLIIGRLIVGRQPPEYSAALPKRFAWTIGLILSSLMFSLLVVMNTYSLITSITCFICLAFLFMETAFGICAGCFLYGLFQKKSACAGGSCATNRTGAQLPTSRAQWLSLSSFVLMVALTIGLFHDQFSTPPKKLGEVEGAKVAQRPPAAPALNKYPRLAVGSE